MFTACHPVLSMEARVALTLRVLGGLTTDEIARAFLVPEATVAQRIVRAKRTLAAARVPFEVPEGAELESRLGSVLEVVYLVFNEGYSATAGQAWMRPALCEEALRLGRMLAELAPGESEVHGLVALMEIQASRLRARTGPTGEAVPLLEQNRGRWDHVLIQRGLAALARAEALGRRPRPVRAAGGDRRLPRPRADARTDGLAAHRGAVRRAGATGADAGGGVEPRGCVELRLRARERARSRGWAARRAGASRLPPAASRARPHAVAAGPPRRGERRARAGRQPHAQCARASRAAPARRSLRPTGRAPDSGLARLGSDTVSRRVPDVKEQLLKGYKGQTRTYKVHLDSDVTSADDVHAAACQRQPAELEQPPPP